MTTSINMLLLFEPIQVTGPPPGSDFIITEDDNDIITEITLNNIITEG